MIVSKKKTSEGEFQVGDSAGRIRRMLHSLGVGEDTCLSLTKLLNSKEEVAAMLWAMDRAEERGEKWGTTEVCLMAEMVKDISERKERQSGLLTDEEPWAM